MTIRQILLAGAALYTVSMAPAVARSAPDIHVMVLHEGQAVVKSRLASPSRDHDTFTASVSTTVPSSDYKIKTKLANTFLFIAGSSTLCHMKLKETIKLATRRTKYATIGKATETTDGGCKKPTVYYGDTYDLKTRKAAGKTDKFESTLVARGFKHHGERYKAEIDLFVSVAIQ